MVGSRNEICLDFKSLNRGVTVSLLSPVLEVACFQFEITPNSALAGVFDLISNQSDVICLDSSVGSWDFELNFRKKLRQRFRFSWSSISFRSTCLSFCLILPLSVRKISKLLHGSLSLVGAICLDSFWEPSFMDSSKSNLNSSAERLSVFYTIFSLRYEWFKYWIIK